MIYKELQEQNEKVASKDDFPINWIDRISLFLSHTIKYLIPVIVGPEVIPGSTRMKAGTATKMVLNMITTTLMIKLNKTYGNLMVDLKASNDKLLDRGTRIIEHLTDLNYDEALNILKSADGEVKTAVVMEKLKVGVEAARDRLRTHKGSLKDVFIKK